MTKVSTDFIDFLVSEEGTLVDAVSKIEQNHCRAVLVTQNSKIVGVLSEGDVLRALLKGSNIYTPIKDIYQRSFKYLMTKNYRDAFRLVQEFGISMVPVVSKNLELLEIMTQKQILDHICSELTSSTK